MAAVDAALRPGVLGDLPRGSSGTMVAALFADLRGFTSFTNRVTPGRVVRLLNDFYRAADDVVRLRSGPQPDFSGDGLMMFFDAAACEEPSVRAAEMALDLRAIVTSDVLEPFTRRGHRLGIGIGIAFGHASFIRSWPGSCTIIGRTVNLAARLCAAAHDEVLVDRRAAAPLQDVYSLSPRRLRLKGFDRPVRAYCIDRWNDVSRTG